MKNILFTLSTVTSLALCGNISGISRSSAGHLSTNLSQNVLVGYWHNWDYSSGEKGGVARYMDLTDVPSTYNVIDVSFLTATAPGTLPSFIPEVPNHPDFTQSQKDALFTSQVDQLHQQNRIVILSLGGAAANIVLKKAQLSALTTSLKTTIDKFHFDGIDIDLENSSVNAADNEYVITNALKTLKTNYAKQSKAFYITMAPEFPLLRSKTNDYGKYLTDLKSYYDFINPQLYNQGGDGVSLSESDKNYLENKLGHEVPWYIAQDNNAYKSEFIYLITKYLTSGETPNNFVPIPIDKLVLGLPANDDAANNGQVNLAQMQGAFKYLKENNINS